MIEITQEPQPRTTIQLDPHTGEALRSLLLQESGMSWRRYVEAVGLHPTNIVNYLSGRNRISLEILHKLIAGTRLRLQCTIHVQILIGEDVQDADCTRLDEMSLLDELDMLEKEGIMIPNLPPPLIPDSSSLEKPQDDKKTTQDYLFKEKVEESSTSPGLTLAGPLLTTLLTQLGADQQQNPSEES